MAGRKQHHIPRLLLRGFIAPEFAPAQRVWLFRRNKAGIVVNIRDAAAQRNFYSAAKADVADPQTLDDVITDYESIVLAPIIARFRACQNGQKVPSDQAAEAVVHLIVRAAHIRDVFE